MPSTRMVGFADTATGPELCSRLAGAEPPAATDEQLLELLTAEKRCTATASVDAISREVALPVDDILAATTALLSRGDGQPAEVAEKLKQILAGARSIKQSIVNVGESLAPAGQGATPGSRLKGMRVLVVDGDDLVRKSAHALIGRFGGEVETARCGAEAVAMARAGHYDAIIVDIRLPDLSGYEAYRRLGDAQPQARMIMMTAFGYDASHSLVKARQDGLRHLVRLREHRGASLLEDLVLRELDHLRGHVDVADAALGGREVLLVAREVVERVLEPVLHGAEGRARRTGLGQEERSGVKVSGNLNWFEPTGLNGNG